MALIRKVFRISDTNALDTTFGRDLAQIALLNGYFDVIATHGKAQRAARDKWQIARILMMVTAYDTQFRITLVTVAAGFSGELAVAHEAIGVIALNGKV